MPADQELTIVALAWNEGRHLRKCFASLRTLIKLTGARTLVVFDRAGDQTTLEVARRVADRVAIFDFVNYSAQRNNGLDLAETGWVFFIDPDERCTSALAEEIASKIRRSDFAAYDVPRRNILFGHEVRHTGWWPDYQTRLLVRKLCRFDEGRPVHEVPVVQGRVGKLKHPLTHFNYETWSQFVGKQRGYASLEAQRLHMSGRVARWRNLVGQPLREFKRRFVDYRGYKDGWLGLALSISMALYTAEVYRQLGLLQRRSRQFAAGQSLHPGPTRWAFHRLFHRFDRPPRRPL